MTAEAEEPARSVPEELHRKRLDRVAKSFWPDRSWAMVRRLIAAGRIRVDGKEQRDEAFPVDAGSRVALLEGDPPARLRPPSSTLVSVKEDREWVALDKPPGLLTVAARGSREESLARIARRRFGRLLLVHRLDKETSGVVLFAKSRRMQKTLLTAFRQGLVRKRYLAVVGERPKERSGTIRSALGRLPTGKRGSVSHGGRESETGFRTIERVNLGWLLEIRPKTGRTHQIRIHLAEMGLPVRGDRLYGGEPAPRLMLHALSLQLPTSDEEIVSPAPAGFHRLRSRASGKGKS